jgi:cobalt-zinc-cadmium efflux system outer membrane protein
MLRHIAMVCLPFVLGGSLVGCASPPNKISTVSAQLQQRMGAGVTNPPAGTLSIPPGVSLQDGLTEDEAVLMALWNNAAFQETLADLGLSRADLINAGMLPNPTLSMLIPIETKPLELTAKYPLEILWLRPRRVKSAKLEYERATHRLVQSGLDLIRDVRLACAEVALANHKVKLGASTLDLNRRIAELSEARLKSGESSELETSAALIDALQAQEQVTRSHQDANIAGERLRNLIGLGLNDSKAQLEEFPPRPLAEPKLEICLTKALATRPDLRAAELGVEAAGKRIGLARAEAFTIAAVLDVNEEKPKWLIGPGIDLAVPIVNQNQGGIAQAKARFEKAARQYFTVRDRTALEVREAHTRLQQAQQSDAIWREKILPPLERSVQQAEKAYSGGNVSYLFVLETTRRVYDARLKAATAAADVRRALAEMERSLGQRLEAVSNPSATDANETR